ncbi:uncharacterized protein LOC111709903 [Eurytemora carolleeae]|uniref:uncharacterized protein LOC111709903 n=1 Tax=Eurytemora carolleeae TaxID=1294199 RepID=UPI000C78CB10|nr:uncharacterized protein LOC111709903 [Eurytemora carolleeae]|eukprot:XP_023339609.1 uncharacterized protein LOC111709903 [Eurytemora affinis]
MVNDSFDLMNCTWDPVLEVPGSVEHKFVLDQVQNLPGILAQGTGFHIPQCDPIEVPVVGGPPVLTGPEFHSLLESEFIMTSPTESSKKMNKTTIIHLPKFIQGKSKTKVRVYIYKCSVKVPCKIIFKIGFQSDFETGSEQWTDTAELESVDRSIVKVEIENVSTNMARKFSKATNGQA